jgi:hypothetical protein
MSRRLETNKYLTTLGFFIDGVPVIFVRSDIVHKANPLMREYLEFYVRSRGDESLSAQFSGRCHYEGFALMATFVHETRHFHDALLSPLLFELFLLHAKQNMCALQLLTEISTLAPKDLPSTPENLVKKLSSRGRLLLSSLDNYQRSFGSRYKDVMKVSKVAGKPVSVVTLLETSAMLMELFTVVNVHGTEAAKRYYQEEVATLEDDYHLLIDIVVQEIPDFLLALSILYHLTNLCLYSANDGASRMAHILSIGGAKNDIWLSFASPQKVRDAFDHEDALAGRISRMVVGDPDTGEKFQIEAIEDPFLREVMALPQRIYMCRSQLISKYLHEFECNPITYIERTDELPMPPVVFFPAEGNASHISAVAASEFALRGAQYYTLVGQPMSNGDTAVIAGMVPVPNAKPCIAFEVADMMLLGRYVQWALLEGGLELYGPVLDWPYERQIKRGLRSRWKMKR